MSGDTEIMYWHSNPEWYRINKDGKFELTDKAPERAIRSFKLANTPHTDEDIFS